MSSDDSHAPHDSASGPVAPRPASTLGTVLFGVVVVAVIAAAAVAFVALRGGEEQPTPPTIEDLQRSLGSVTPVAGTGMVDRHAPEIDRPAPDFALIDIADGVTVRKLSDFRGKPVVLNFFFRDCAPCKKEMPYFEEVYKRQAGAVVFLGVDGIDTRSRAQGFLKDVGVTFPALLDTGAEVNEHYRLRGWPVTFFVDTEGILRGLWVGQVPEDKLADQLATIGVVDPPP
jgi:cytochrome c biogenesis protein CcmG, thiol:disulfide interchange protein DsbE